MSQTHESFQAPPVSRIHDHFRTHETAKTRRRAPEILRRALSSWCELLAAELMTPADRVAKYNLRRTAEREMLLEPNHGSQVKIERYSFGLCTSVTLGVVGCPLTLTGQPDVNIRPQRVFMNAPTPGFAIIEQIRVANVAVTVGLQEDAFHYSALAQNSHLDMPTISPANRATVLGEMTGRIPRGFGFKKGESYLFSVTFQGPASIIA